MSFTSVRIWLVLCALPLLAACGADGEPETPTRADAALIDIAPLN